MLGWNRVRSVALLMAPAVMLAVAPSTAAAATQTPAGAGALVGTIAWGAGMAPPLVGPCSGTQSGQASFDMVVAISSGSSSYAGPIHVDAGFVSAGCASVVEGVYKLSGDTMSGSSPTGTISCDAASSANQGFAQAGTVFLFGIPDITCYVNQVPVPHLSFSVTLGVIVPTGVDSSGHETAAAAGGPLDVLVN